MIRATVALTLIVAAFSPAYSQTRSPSALKSAQQFFVPCDRYHGTQLEFCKFGQKEFSEDWADANAGRLVSWRNVAFFFSRRGAIYSNPEEYMGIKQNLAAACAWRLAVIAAPNVEPTSADRTNAAQDCDGFNQADLDHIRAVALTIVRNTPIRDEEDPKAPWADPTPPPPGPGHILAP